MKIEKFKAVVSVPEFGNPIMDEPPYEPEPYSHDVELEFVPFDLDKMDDDGRYFCIFDDMSGMVANKKYWSIPVTFGELVFMSSKIND